MKNSNLFAGATCQPINSVYFAFSWRGNSVQLNERELSLVNRGACPDSGMLDLGNPDAFRYIVCSREQMISYVVGILSLNMEVELSECGRAKALLAHRARAMVDAVPHEVFLRYGAEFVAPAPHSIGVIDGLLC